MPHALSFDIEDEWTIICRDWLRLDDIPSEHTVARDTEWILQTLAEHEVTATFFILGEVAVAYPDLVKKIAGGNHEIGVHGFYHRPLFDLTREQFRTEVGDAKKLLEDITGCQVQGHRAPSFSINADTEWALEVLAETEFKYDSSVFPITSRRYGWPHFNKDICQLNLPSGATIVEVPMSTVSCLGKTLPAVGGSYLRLLPYAITKWAMKRIEKLRPAIVYMHPYEVDTSQHVLPMDHLRKQERQRISRRYSFQLYNRKSVPGKLRRLLSDFEFTSIIQVIHLRLGGFPASVVSRANSR